MSFNGFSEMRTVSFSRYVATCSYCGRQPSGLHMNCEGCGAPVSVLDANDRIEVTTLGDARRVYVDARTGRRCE